ncbi:MAG: NAD-dependent epimerase/dehydratase family protein [Terracoccus sp.]
MTHHLVLGAGGIGRAATTHLVARGHTVTLASRSGIVALRPWEELPGGSDAVTVATVDAADPAALTLLATGAASIVNAINPPSYTSWEQDWPPVAEALLLAAERSGAGLVTIGNLYNYGRVDAPMSEETVEAPNGHKGALRAAMWQEARSRHEAGRLRATELRASDYFGPGAQARVSLLNDSVISRAAKGSAALLPMGVADAAHSWTYLPDIGELAAVLATDDRSWGRVWHVPTAPARTVREVAADVARLTGHRAPAVRVVPRPLITVLGTVVPLLKEVRETRHQLERPFVIDATRAEQTFGLSATPWDEALTATVVALGGTPAPARA